MAGIIGTILSTSRTVINGAQALIAKIDLGGGYIISPQLFLSPGEDSRPLPGDSLAGLPLRAAGRFVGVGAADPVNTGIAAAGEVRRYSRDSDGVIQATVHLKEDGSIEITSVAGGSSFVMGAGGSISGTNGAGSFELEAGGDFVINGATISAAGEITNAAGIVLGTHGTSPGTFTTPTGGDVSGVGGPPV